MGRPKTMASLGGRPLVGHPVAAARAVDVEPWVVAKPETPLPELGCRVLREPEAPLHPLAGLVAALREAGARPVVALAADMPFVEDKLIAWLASHPSTTVVEGRGRIQPLLGRYRSADADRLEASLRAGAAATAAVLALEPRVVPEHDLARFGDPARLLFNVNTEADLAAAEEIIAASRARP
jgi:molybdopterin-guanine dinucleotide biosynthesis protein A